MSAFPIALDAESISVLVVGGGQVATRKALALLAAGATVTIVAPEVSDELDSRGREDGKLSIVRREYGGAHDIGNATLVIAATPSRYVNSRIAMDAQAAFRLVNVVDAPAAGTFTTMAVHRTGDVVVGVSAGGVPSAARRIRDRIASRIDSRYAQAVSACAALRARTLADSQPDAAVWPELHARLIADDFCDIVEDGSFAARIASCR